MAGTSTPAQEPASKAEADRLAAEKKAEAGRVAAEKKAEADRLAAEKKAAAEKVAADKAAAAQPEAKLTGYTVTGAAVVLRSDDGAERYLYRGAPVDESAFSEESIKHAISVGLIEKAK